MILCGQRQPVLSNSINEHELILPATASDTDLMAGWQCMTVNMHIVPTCQVTEMPQAGAVETRGTSRWLGRW